MEVFREVRRVLRDDGTVWLNYGDGYPDIGRAGRMESPGVGATQAMPRVRRDIEWRSGPGHNFEWQLPGGFRKGSLMMMANRLAIALHDDGWTVRDEIIWRKPNAMPGGKSAKNRTTRAHEKVWLLTKVPSGYFYDDFAVRTYDGDGWHGDKFAARSPERHGGENRTVPAAEQQAGANLRSVWSIATVAYPDAHFATFPPDLPRDPIRAGTSEYGVCAACGAPWHRIVEKQVQPPDELTDITGQKMEYHRLGQAGGQVADDWRKAHPPRTLCWWVGCECEAGRVPATVLDPFGGAGTLGLTAHRLGRSAIIVDISAEYAAMTERRLRADQQMFADIEVR